MAADKTIGLKRFAKQKQQETVNRVNLTINMMIANKDEINFATVANIAKVSRTWLYKKSKFREQIKQLKLNNNKYNQSIILKKDKNIQIEKLKEKIKKVEKENSELKKQIEILYGKLYNIE